jgi:transcriptional regulator with XRE-family HTH domain
MSDGGATLGIIASMPTRHRPTDLEREIVRVSSSISVALGQVVRAGRIRLSLTQLVVSARVGISQTAWSRIERGLGGHVPLQTWVAIGVALGRPLAVNFSRPLDEARGPADAGHLEIQEYVLRLAQATGQHGTFELPTRPTDAIPSTDVGSATTGTASSSRSNAGTRSVTSAPRSGQPIARQPRPRPTRSPRPRATRIPIACARCRSFGPVPPIEPSSHAIRTSSTQRSRVRPGSGVEP